MGNNSLGDTHPLEIKVLRHRGSTKLSLFHSSLRALALREYWASLAGGAVPERRLFEPTAVPNLLPFIFLVQFEWNPFRVKYRLAGTAVEAMSGAVFAGFYLDEFDFGAKLLAQLTDWYQVCFESGQPVVGEYLWPTVRGRSSLVTLTLFPLKVRGEIEQAVVIEDWAGLAPEDSWVPVKRRAANDLHS